MQVHHSTSGMARSVSSIGNNLSANAYNHSADSVLVPPYSLNVNSGEVGFRITGTRDDMLAIAEAAAGVVGATIYDPKDDADSEMK